MLYTSKYVQTYTFKHSYTHTLAWPNHLPQSTAQAFIHAYIMHIYLHKNIQTNTHIHLEGLAGGWGKAPQAKLFSQPFIFSVLLYLLRQKVLQKLTSEIKCYIEWELQKDVDIKFKAVFHSICLLQVQSNSFCMALPYSAHLWLHPQT